MNQQSPLKIVLVVLLSWLLTACGGGGGEGGLGVTPDPGGGTAVPTITLTLVDSQGIAVTEINGTDEATARAVVRDSTGDAVVGNLVSFAVTIGLLAGNGAAVTNSSGIATITVTAGTSSGAGTVSATASVDEDGVVTNIASDAVAFATDGQGSSTDPVDLQVDLVMTPTTISRTSPGTVTLTFSDDLGDPIADAIVTFSSSVTSSGGELGDVALFTDSNGLATTTLTAGTGEGAATLNASVVFGNETVVADTFNFITAGDAIATLTLALSGSGPISTAAPSTVTATVIGADGQAEQSIPVNFILSSSIGSLNKNQDATNANGEASVILSAGTGSGFGEISASATVAGKSLASDPISFESLGDDPFTGQGSSSLGIALALIDSAGDSIDPPNIDADNPGILQATVTDTLGGVQNIIVRFTADTGDLFPTSGLKLTNANGIATASLAAGSDPGAGIARAIIEIDGQQFDSDSLNFSTLGNAGDTAITVTLTFSDATPGNSSNIVTTSEPGTLNIQVEDSASADLPNRTAVITTTLGILATGTCPIDEADGVDTLIAVSDAAGRISLTVCGYSTIGTGDIVVTVGDTSETVQFDVGVDGLQIGRLLRSSIVGERIKIVSLVGATAGTVDINEAVVVISTSGITLVAGVDYTVTADGTGITCIGASAECIEGVSLTISYENLTPGFIAEELTVSVDPLSAGGVSKVTVSVVDQAENPIANIDITFSSNCAETIDPESGQAEALISRKVASENTGATIGDSVATYQANGCVGPDVITATETSSGATASGTIEVLPAQIGSIKFDSVVVDPDDPSITSIQIKESGGIDRGNVVFQVLDVTGDPAPDQNVKFELTSNIGGLALVNDEGLTDADGKVSATVAAGFIPTTVRVRASLAVDTDDDGETDTTLVTLSELLTVNTGIPDQNSMSISTSGSNIEGNGMDGLTTNITVRMSDAFNNPVTDGTAVTFRTELGSIEPECTTSGGACSVVLTTQDPRTPLDPNVSFKTLADGCPATRITDELVTISGTSGETNYRMDINSTVVVQSSLDTFYTEGLAGDYTIDTDGGGITCVADGTGRCDAGEELKVTYNRLWLDEKPYDVVDEEVTIAGLAWTTVNTVDTDTSVVVIDVSDDRTLVEGIDYAVSSTGITCIATSTECINDAALTISYDKVFAGDKTHVISNPGVATLPFTNVTGVPVPCRASLRAATETASAYNSGLGQPYGARSTVLAYALGEESFIDSNGNGLYDFLESFVDLPEAFLDKNEDGVFNNGIPAVDDSRDLANPLCYGPVSPITVPGQALDVCYQDGGEEETFIDFGDDATLNRKYDAGNLIYNGTLCPKEISDRTGPCADPLACLITERYCTRDLVNIRREIDILLSGSGAIFGRRNGNDGELVRFFDLSGGLGANQYTATSTVTANDGTLIAPGTIFTVGDADSNTEVSPGIGELVTLISGSSFIVIDIADIYNGYLPATASISVVSGTDGCVIQNTPSGVVGNRGSVGFSQVWISVAPPTNPPGGAPITISVTTADGGVLSETSVSCAY